MNLSIIREPLLWANLVKGVFAVLVAFGISVTMEQQDAIITLITAVLAIAVVFVPAVIAERNAVTPVAAPRLPEGRLVEAIREDPNDPTYHVVV